MRDGTKRRDDIEAIVNRVGYISCLLFQRRCGAFLPEDVMVFACRWLDILGPDVQFCMSSDASDIFFPGFHRL